MSNRIIQLTAQNVKRLRAVSYRPNGRMVVVGGRNEQGKSSLLDSIAMALGGKDEVPSVPIRDGEEKAFIVLELEDLVIERTFTAAGSALVVRDKKGKRLSSPQAILDRLTGKLTFDPLAFIGLPAPKQAALLRETVGLDFSEFEFERAKIFGERTLVNREIDSAQERIKIMPFHADAPEREQSASDVIGEIERAQACNQATADQQALVVTVTTALAEARSNVEKCDVEISDLEKQLVAKRESRVALAANVATVAARLKTAQEVADSAQTVSLDPLKEKLNQLELINRKVRDNAMHVAAVKAHAEKSAAAAAITARIAEIDKEKERQLVEAKFPVDGLGFTPDFVTFNGVPFAQASSSRRLRVSVAIAAATNPGLKVMLVRDGSLLDDDGMELLAQLAEEHDLQVWIERVGTDDLCSIVIEDGAIMGSEESVTTTPVATQLPAADKKPSIFGNTSPATVKPEPVAVAPISLF